MANRLGVDITELFELAQTGAPISISSMCTVFAESEIISQIGAGEPRQNIAAGVVDSVATKVANLAKRHGVKGACVLTGGLSKEPFFAQILTEKLNTSVLAPELGAYAGALGAALLAREKFPSA